MSKSSSKYPWRLLLAGVAAGLVALCIPVKAASLVGGLYVKTEPEGAVVWVAGQVKGVSPCGIADVGIGLVEVRAGKDGYATKTTTVEVESDQVKVVELELTKLENVGHLVVLVDPPGATIEVDRIPRGKTPARITNLTAGTHNVKVSKTGYRPMYARITVSAGQDGEVRGELEKIEGFMPSLPALGESEEFEGAKKLEDEDIPSPEQMPEEKTFQEIRQLISRRDYEQALNRLDEMAQQEGAAAYAQRIARDRQFIRHIQQVVKAGWEGLKRKEGKQYELLLRQGITLTGTILEVGESELLIDLFGTGKGTAVPMEKVHPDRLVRLAAYSMDKNDPANQAKFALLFAAEGEFDRAYEALRLAAEGGYPVAEIQNYVETERLWAAAQQKAQEEAARKKAEELRKKQEEKKPLPKPEERKGKPPRILVERGRGGYISREFIARLEVLGMVVNEKYGVLDSRDLEQAEVLLIRDPGEGTFVRPYDANQIEDILRFVRGGGGLIIIGACRTSEPEKGRGPVQNPFNALLKPIGVQIRNDALAVSESAPEERSREVFPCYASRKHPITLMASKVVFRGCTPTLSLRDPRWGLVRGGKFIGSRLAGPSPWVVAAGEYGSGRAVVFATMPSLYSSDFKHSPFYKNQAERMLLNAVGWAAHAGRK